MYHALISFVQAPETCIIYKKYIYICDYNIIYICTNIYCFLYLIHGPMGNRAINKVQKYSLGGSSCTSLSKERAEQMFTPEMLTSLGTKSSSFIGTSLKMSRLLASWFCKGKDFTSRNMTLKIFVINRLKKGQAYHGKSKQRVFCSQHATYVSTTFKRWCDILGS